MVLYGITRRIPFWIALALLSTAGGFFSYRYFSRAFPIQTITITMDRHQALAKAQELAKTHGWQPANAQQSARFMGSPNVQYYVELEAGGTKELTKVLHDPVVSVYGWRIRHFAEFDPHETQIFFKPDGTFYGFKLKIPETQEGPQLSKEEAQAIVEKEIAATWHIDLTHYELVETGKQELPSGRLDHLFTYDLKERKIGEAPIRLYTKLSGDHLSELRYEVKVPEAFKRRYKEMRSYNEAIANIAHIAGIGFLYLFICLLFGLFFLVRKNLLSWKKAFLWAFIVALLNTFSSFNELPSYWSFYNTATSKWSFLFNLAYHQIISLLISTCTIGLLFSVAESLTRLAFGGQPQLWRSWSKGAIDSLQTAGRTIAGYLLVSLLFAYVVAFYWIVLTKFGWWSPSDILYDPNVLSSYLPWLTPVARSLQAGFLEECLFRAIPLASAIIFGRWIGYERLCLGLMFIAQCLIFSAAHATYAAQPAYARLVELLVPSAFFGLIYLLFGLLPGIICHFVYDLVWFGLTLMLSEAPSALIHKIFLLLAGAVPLLLVLYARLAHGKWRELPVLFYNQAWQQTEKIEPYDPTFLTEGRATPIHLSVITSSVLVLLSIGLWSFVSRFDADQPRITTTTAQVTEIAHKQAPSVTAAAPWVTLPIVELERPRIALNALQAHHFIWQEGGKQLYRELSDRYLLPFHWAVRLTRFEGDVADRAEEYCALMSTDGTPLVTTHTLPEGRSAESITEQEAAQLALSTIKKQFNLDADALSLISIRPHQRPARIDWTVLYKVKDVSVPTQGQARIRIRIAGKEVVFIKPFIFVPEEWRRSYQNRTFIEAIIQSVSSWFFIMLFFIAIVAVLFYTRFKRFSVVAALSVAAIFIAKSCLHTFNILPTLYATFVTTHPWSHQLWTSIGTTAIQILLKALIVAATVGLVQRIRFKAQRNNAPFAALLLQGFAVGALASALRSLLITCAPAIKPFWILDAPFHAATHIPWFSYLVADNTNFLTVLPLAVITYVGLDYLTAGMLKRQWLLPVTALLFGLSASANLFAASPFYLLLVAPVFALAFCVDYLVTRVHVISVMGSACAVVMLSAIQLALIDPFPLAMFAGCAAAVIYLLCTVIWAWFIYKQDATT